MSGRGRPKTGVGADPPAPRAMIRFWSIALVGLLALFQYSLWLGDGGALDVWRLERAIAAQRAENAELRQRNRRLEAEVVDLKEGLEAVEERARRELGMIGPGETFYQVVERDELARN